MDNVLASVENRSGLVLSVVFVVALVIFLYVVYKYLYPSTVGTHVELLSKEADARTPVKFSADLPKIFTGSDFTLSFWIYVDDWTYRSNMAKYLFVLGPQTQNDATRNILTAVLTPNQNSMLLQGNTVDGVSGSSIPNINIPSNLESHLTGKMPLEMYTTALSSSPEKTATCNLSEVSLQRWTCITIVSSGRMLDVYMDGKLSRSCVLPNILDVPRVPLSLRMGEKGGFGGSISSVQMWNQQLAPDAIYGIYRAGPSQTRHNIFRDLSRFLGLDVSFTGAQTGSSSASIADESKSGCSFNASGMYASTKDTVGGWSDSTKDYLMNF